MCRSVLNGKPPVSHVVANYSVQLSACNGELGLLRPGRMHKDITIPLGLSENGGYVHRLDRDIMSYNTVYIYIYIAEDKLALNLYISIYIYLSIYLSIYLFIYLSIYLSIYLHTLSYPINIQQFTIMFTNIHGNGKSTAYR